MQDLRLFARISTSKKLNSEREISGMFMKKGLTAVQWSTLSPVFVQDAHGLKTELLDAMARL
jgi:hypothetical protein